MMKPLLVFLSLGIALWLSVSPQRSYTPPKVTSAGDAYIPYQFVEDGLFVLDLSISDQGKIQRIDALRNPGSMVGAAETSVATWKFRAASEGAKATCSRLTAVFVYRPPNYGSAGAVPPKHFSPVIPPDRSDREQKSDYIPVGILSFDYPEYPIKSVAWGSVVVQVTVSDSADVTDVEFLHTMAGFDGLVRQALTKWRFQPATIDGTPVTAKIVIAFVFQIPPNTTF